MMNTSFFGELLQSISDRGRALLDRSRERRGDAPERSANFLELCEELLSGRGEASGVALAREILARYNELTIGPRIAFFEALASRYGVDRKRLDAAVAAWQAAPSEEAAAEIPSRGRTAAAGTVPPAQSCAQRNRCACAHARADHRRDGPPR